jgi:hypothetical protein
MGEITRNYLGDQINAIAREISKLAIACDIDIFDPDVAEKILKNDDSVCGRINEKAFRELRTHVLAVFPLRKQAVDEMGARETKEIMQQIRTAIIDLRNPGQNPENKENREQ